MNSLNPSIQMGGIARPNPGPNQNNATLYVGNIDKDLDDQRIFEFFNSFGNVASCKVKRDFGGESRGFWFVTYNNKQDAERAKLTLNHTKIKENDIVISFLRSQDLDPNANLFFRNLDINMSAKELEEKCSIYGEIHCCKLKRDEDGKSIGYGYVQFEKDSSATDCLNALNGTTIHEKEITVERFVPKSKRGIISKNSNLYVKDFQSGLNAAQVENFIDEKFGTIAPIKSKGVFTDNKLNKIYAFVAYENAEKAGEAVQALNGFEMANGAKLFVDFAQTKQQRKQLLREKHTKYTNKTNLYIRSLAPHVTEDLLRSTFQKFGPTTSVFVKTHELQKKNPQGVEETKSMKFGFINFSNGDDASKAHSEGKKDEDILNLIDESHFKGAEFLYFAQPKSMRTQYLRMQRKNHNATKMYENIRKQNEEMYKFFNRAQQQQGMNRKRRGNNPMNPNEMMMANMNPMMFMQMMQQAQMSMNAGGMPIQNPQMANMGMGLQHQPQNTGIAQFPGTQFPGAQFPGMALPGTQFPGMGNMGQMHPAANFGAPQMQKDVNWLKANLVQFNNYQETEKKSVLGNLMYPRVMSLNPPSNQVPKITGMLIDQEVLTIEEIIEILEVDEILKERMEEAMKIIEEDDQN